MVPGALTPSEVVSAWQLGASAVKLFPASIGGPGLVKAISAPLGHIPLMVTGGVDDSNAATYIAAGAIAVGVGGWLVGGDDLETIRDRATKLVDAVVNANV